MGTTVFSDAYWANCGKTRESTPGGCILFGSHLLCAWSKTQATIALSTAESETLAAIKAGAAALGMMTLMAEMVVGQPSLIATLRLDAPAALGILQRRGVGNIRHLDVGCLCLQGKEARQRLKFAKEPCAPNPSD